ncbi:MAG TPA: LuxR C-terminal-related transcriptional regulator [Ktedonobacteraceae bacterium]|nr:LuxR C-terminal-related transcriptional regulator [Ktedonobacteraceae bacterium]
MARHPISQVIDDQLTPLDRTGGSLPTIQVGSADWYAWLNEAATRSFAYHSAQGFLTVRRERRGGTWYWYAYRTRNGQLRKAYLGKAEELTALRLNQVATALSVETAAGIQEPVTSKAASLSVPTSSSSTPRFQTTNLLMTKFYVPPARSRMVPRPHLMERLNAGMRSKLILVIAPAGYGKTSLLSAWQADPNRPPWPFAWVSLDRSDNDPARFWTYVITALDMLHAGVGETALALLRSPQPPPVESVLTSLLNALTSVSVETVLVLDDYHMIEAQPIHDALTFLLEHLPPNFHLIIASRVDPLLSLARLRARGTLTELRIADLRFTLEEASAFLIELMALQLEPSEVAALEARTEGWIAGLHLAALSMQGRDDLAGFIKSFTGSSRYVIDYLAEEVLSRQPEAVQHFLLQTSILDRLSSSLCDAVRGKGDSQVLLAYVERANLFLIPLDDERQWYRYHHLCTEVLRNRMLQTEPGLLPELHRHASLWYEQHEMLAEAVQHALAIPDVERAADLIELRGMVYAQRGQAHMVLGWLNTLPDELVRARPMLCIIHALVLMLSHQLEAAEARLQDAERSGQPNTAEEQIRLIMGLVAAIRATFDIFSGNLARNVALSQQALDLLPETEAIMRAGALVGAARAFLVSGDVTPASERLVRAVAAARSSGNLVSVLRGQTLLARLHLLQGKLHQAATTFEEMVQGIPGQGELRVLVSGPSYYFGLGDLLREWNNLDAAERLLIQGMELVSGLPVVEAEVVTRGYMALARLQQARGEYRKALATLDAFTRVAHRCGFVPPLAAHGHAVRAQVELAQGNRTAAIYWADTSGLSANDALGYPREQEYLALARVRITQGRENPDGPFLSETLVLLERLREDAEAKMRMQSEIEILILRSLALQVQGDRMGALTALGRALILAEPEGYIRLVIDEGAPMAALLRQAYTHKIAPTYVATLLQAGSEPLAPGSPPQRSSPLIEPPTPREREVLELLMDGASNEEIAHHLVISLNTVKKHVFNICSKLGVQNRTQAVVRAKALELL